MKYNFDEIIDRTGTSSLKWEKYKNTDILPMWVADMDFKAPPALLDTLKKSIDHGILGYTRTPESLNTIIQEKMKTLYGWEIEKEWLIWVPGVVCALNLTCRTFCSPPKKIITTTPIYPPFLAAPGNSGKPLVTVPMVDINHRATLDFEALEKEFKNNAGLFMFCSPYNPCGTVFTREELHRLATLCSDNDVVVCSDEIHSDFVLHESKHHIPTASVSQTAADQTITLMAPSKTYNIPGLGCSFVIIPDQTHRAQFSKSLSGLIPDVNLLGLFAAETAYKDCDDWIAQLIVYLRQNRDLVFDRINKMKGCKLNPVESTYLAWIDVRDTGIEDPVRFFEQAGVGLSDGIFFGQKGFIRLNFGCPRSVLEKGLDRMAHALKNL